MKNFRRKQPWLALVAAGGCWLGGAAGLWAQQIQPFQEEASTPPPVRRAQPVTPGSNPPVARALPVGPSPAVSPASDTSGADPGRRSRRPGTTAPIRPNEPAPGDNGPDEPVDPTPRLDTPTPAPRTTTTAAEGRPRPAAAPSGDVSPAPVVGAADTNSPRDGDEEGGEIRIAPQQGRPVTSPEDTQFNLANRFYVGKDYAQAAAEYERYLGKYPDGKQRQAALWWLGESYRFLGRAPAAKSTYQMLTISFQDGEFVGPANFRVATMTYEARDYQTALGYFRKAADLTKAQDVKLYARFSEALCLEQLGRKDETREVYEDILAVPKDNPYRDDARLKLAQLAVSQHRTGEAFKQYQALAGEAAKPAVQADSALKAGILAHELGQDDDAMTLLTRASSLPGAGVQVRSEASLAQLHLLYDTSKYKELLAAYPGIGNALPAGLQPEALLLAANSQRQLGRHQEARAIYDQIITQYSGTPQAPEARYQRVISLYAADDPNFVKEADDFLLISPDTTKTDQVRLMKADTLFKRRDYQAAALAYGTLEGSVGLSPKYRAEAAYRLGYCYSQARQPEKTVAAFTKFLRLYPDSPLAAKAFMQRGAAYQQLKNYGSALQDFTEVVNDHKDAKEREVAMFQRALILGAQNETRGMIEAFRNLLKEYPNTDAAAQAHSAIANAYFSDLKDYAAALPEFDAARKGATKENTGKYTLMMILCDYQLKDKAKLAAEVEGYQKTKPATAVPPTILGWLGQQEYDDKSYASAEEHLTAAAASPGATPDTFLTLAHARLNLQKWDGAAEAVSKYLAAVASEPDSRAQGLLVQGEAQLGQKQYPEALKTIEDTLYIQPEGKLNARALLLRGRVEAAQGKYTDAAKSYMSVAVLYDDNEITPEALRQAAEAYEKAGQRGDAAKAKDELKARFPGFTAAKAL